MTVRGDVVFVGHGIVAPEQKWNDYAGVDVKGKWVLIMVNDPPAPADEPTLFGGPALTYYGRWTYKFEEAARQGAAGALLIHTDESATYPWQVVQSSWTGTQYALPPAAGAPALGVKAWMRMAPRPTSRRAAAGARRAAHGRVEARLHAGAAGRRGDGDAARSPRRARRRPTSIGVLRGANEQQGGRIYVALGSLRQRGAARPATRRMPTAFSTAPTTTRPALPRC